MADPEEPRVLDYDSTPRARTKPLLIAAGSIAVVTGAGIYWLIAATQVGHTTGITSVSGSSSWTTGPTSSTAPSE